MRKKLEIFGEPAEITEQNSILVKNQGQLPVREGVNIFPPTLLSPFGPCIYYNTISPDCFNALADASKIARQKKTDMSSSLAGVIREQYDLIPHLTDDVVYKHLNDHCHEYLSLQSGLDPSMITETPHDLFEHTGLWVNFQQTFEYQPEHVHTGVVSYVIYLQNPLTQEEAEQNVYDRRVDGHTRESLAGKINLHYGEQASLSQNNFYHYPQEGDILMFPSWLGHSVHPFFKGGVERISVAGNVSLINNSNENI